MTITAVAASGPAVGGIDFTPALTHAHASGVIVMNPGTGLDLAAPLKFNHAANLPFNDRGTGITFSPATAFARSSNEPVQPLGSGIKLDRPLARDHAIDAVVHDAAVTTAGYQGSPAPNHWFGGPALTASGSMVLRDAAGLVVDSLNYGLWLIRVMGRRGLPGKLRNRAERLPRDFADRNWWLRRAPSGR